MSFSNYMTMAAVPYNNFAHPQNYGREEYLELPEVWDPNLDPSLRFMDSMMLSSYDGQPIDRFLVEPEKSFFTVNRMPSGGESFGMDLQAPYQAIGTAPYPCGPARPAVSPSQKSLSVCGSELSHSPEADRERFLESFQSPRSFEECRLYSTPSSIGHETPELIYTGNMTFGSMAVPDHINMSEVQGVPDLQDTSFQTDPQEVTFNNEDEGYMDVDMKLEAANETDIKPFDQKDFSRSHRHPSDEGIGRSVQDEASPGRNEPVIKSEATSLVTADADDHDEDDEDADAEADDDDADDEIPTNDPSDDDTEYSPKATRHSKRRRTTSSRHHHSSTSSPPSKRTKFSKSSRPSTSKSSPLQCKSCSHTAKDVSSLQKHVAASHTRPYICAFAFAGCPSTFASKNEWKRHVASQHLSLYYWRCELGACGSGHQHQSSTKEGKNGRNSSANSTTDEPSQAAAQTIKTSDFNRKDLFTQHLRRMHAPFAVKRKNAKSAEWEDRVKHLQSTCMRTRRQPPTKTKCPLPECGMVFEGKNAWDERMEHVGRHLERRVSTAGTGMGLENGNVNTHGINGKEEIDQGDDEFTVGWALREGVIERTVLPGGGRGFRLVGVEGGHGRKTSLGGGEGEEDAEGEDE